MRTATSKDGTQIGFWRSGFGQALLLVHGTTANHNRWANISKRFEKRFLVYSLDRRGRGASGDSSSYSIMREAEDIAAVVDAIGEPTFVVGHSFGGLVSMEASLLTDKMRKLVLYEPPILTGLPMVEPGIIARMQDLVDRGELEPALEVFFREVVKMPEYELKDYRQLPMWKERIKLAPTIPRELEASGSYQFQADKFSDLQLPVLFLVGEKSPPYFHDATRTANSAIQNGQIVELPGELHIAMDTNPTLFEKEVVKFLLG